MAVAAWPARWLRHRGPPPGRAGRADHGLHPPPRPAHHARLCPAGEAGQREPGPETRPMTQGAVAEREGEGAWKVRLLWPAYCAPAGPAYRSRSNGPTRTPEVDAGETPTGAAHAAVGNSGAPVLRLDSWEGPLDLLLELAR